MAPLSRSLLSVLVFSAIARADGPKPVIPSQIRGLDPARKSLVLPLPLLTHEAYDSVLSVRTIKRKLHLPRWISDDTPLCYK
jgi:hypothetical protein